MKLAVLINNLASCYNLQGCCLNNAWTTLLLCLSSIVRKMLKTLGDARGLGLGLGLRLGSGIDIVRHQPSIIAQAIATPALFELAGGWKSGREKKRERCLSYPAFPPTRFSSRPQKVPPIRFPGAQLFHSSRNKPVSKQ